MTKNVAVIGNLNVFQKKVFTTKVTLLTEVIPILRYKLRSHNWVYFFQAVVYC